MLICLLGVVLGDVLVSCFAVHGYTPSFYLSAGLVVAIVILGGTSYILPCSLAALVISSAGSRPVEIGPYTPLVTMLGCAIKLHFTLYLARRSPLAVKRLFLTLKDAAFTAFKIALFPAILENLFYLGAVFLLNRDFFYTYLSQDAVSVFLGFFIATMTVAPTFTCFVDKRLYGVRCFAKALPVLVVGLAAILLFWQYLSYREMNDLREHMAMQTNAFVSDCNQDLEQCNDVFYDVNAAMFSIDSPFKASIKEYMQKIVANYWLCSTMAWAPRVKPNQREAFEKQFAAIDSLANLDLDPHKDLYPVAFVVGTNPDISNGWSGNDVSELLDLYKTSAQADHLPSVLIPDIFVHRRFFRTYLPYYLTYAVVRPDGVQGLLFTHFPLRTVISNNIKASGLEKYGCAIDIEACFRPNGVPQHVERFYNQNYSSDDQLFVYKNLEAFGVVAKVVCSQRLGAHLEQLQATVVMLVMMASLSIILIAVIIGVGHTEMTHYKVVTATKELKRKTDYYHAVMSSIDEAIFGVDVDGRVNYLNRMACKMSQFEARDLFQCVLHDRIHPLCHDDNCVLRKYLKIDIWQEIVKEDLERLAAENLPIEAQPYYVREVGRVSLKRSSMSNILCDISAAGIVEDNHPIGVVLFVRDVTQSCYLMNVKKDIISVVCHELRTPVMGLYANLEMLSMNSPFCQAEAKLLGCDPVLRARHLVKRLKRITDDIDIIDAIRTGHVQLERENITAESLLNSMLKEYSRDVDNNNNMPVTFRQKELWPERLQIESCEGVVYGDRGRLVQVLRHLVSNALKFSYQDSHVVLNAQYIYDEANDNCRSVLFAVKNRGDSIPQTEIESIFDDFYVADPSDNRAHGGIGLGLTVSRGLIQAHGGRLWIESQPDAWTEAKFVIPDSSEPV